MNTDANSAIQNIVQRRDDAIILRNSLTRMLGWSSHINVTDRMALRAARDVADDIVSIADADLEMLRASTRNIGRGKAGTG